MGNKHHVRQKLTDMERSCEQYLAFWFIVSIAASALFGWPALLAWVGTVVGMRLFCDAMKCTTPHKPAQPRNRRKRCCD